ncbi:hypothetical protein JCM16303_004089 [Sporobolomyces ruberrimus]
MSTSSTPPTIASTSTITPSTMSATPAEPPTEAKLLSTDSPSLLSSSLATASSLLHSHLPVAFPTETVYGLGASALSSTAVERIFSAKGRPSDNPLIVHIGTLEMLHDLLPRSRSKGKEKEGSEPIGLNPMYSALIEKFWPGPLSLVFNLEPTSSSSHTSFDPPKLQVVPEVTANQPSLCIRMPSHPLALELLKTSNLPLAAPSANLSSRPSPTSARHVMDDLGKGRGVGAVLDGGNCTVGVESTVVDYVEEAKEEDTSSRGGQLRILRAGGISAEDIEECLKEAGFETSTRKEGGQGRRGGGIVQVYSRDFKSSSLESNPTTPGMKYKHYSPGNSKVVLVKANGGKDNKFLPSLQELVQLSCLTQQKEEKTFKVGLMLSDKTLQRIGTTSHPLTPTETETLTTPLRINLPPPPPSLFAQLTDNEESNLPELDTIEIYSLPLSRAGGDHTNVGEEAARNLFSGLRYFDSMGGEGVDLILVECVEEIGVGLAVMERARKAAGGIERGGEMEFAV